MLTFSFGVQNFKILLLFGHKRGEKRPGLDVRAVVKSLPLSLHGSGQVTSPSDASYSLVAKLMVGLDDFDDSMTSCLP